MRRAKRPGRPGVRARSRPWPAHAVASADPQPSLASWIARRSRWRTPPREALSPSSRIPRVVPNALGRPPRETQVASLLCGWGPAPQRRQAPGEVGAPPSGQDFRGPAAGLIGDKHERAYKRDHSHAHKRAYKRNNVELFKHDNADHKPLFCPSPEGCPASVGAPFLENLAPINCDTSDIVRAGPYRTGRACDARAFRPARFDSEFAHRGRCREDYTTLARWSPSGDPSLHTLAAAYSLQGKRPEPRHSSRGARGPRCSSLRLPSSPSGDTSLVRRAWRVRLPRAAPRRMLMRTPSDCHRCRKARVLTFLVASYLGAGGSLGSMPSGRTRAAHTPT